jgi:3-hydroxybutyryl-CoA dehydrogenase
VGLHFFNPAPVVKAVEVVRGLLTSDETMQTARWVVEKAGKTPLEVSDSPGLVSNRLLLPMINEAMYALMQGVATVEAIDSVMKLGQNHAMGPLEMADWMGLDTCLSLLESLHAALGDSKFSPCPLLRKMVAGGYLGRKSGRGFYRY